MLGTPRKANGNLVSPRPARQAKFCRLCEAKTSLLADSCRGLCPENWRHEGSCRWAQLSQGLRECSRDLEESRAGVARLEAHRRGLDAVRAKLALEASQASAGHTLFARRVRDVKAEGALEDAMLDADRVEAQILDLEEEEHERALFLEDNLAFLSAQAKAILHVDLCGAMCNETDVEANSEAANSGMQLLNHHISDFQSLLEQTMLKARGIDSSISSTASPASTAGSLSCLEDVEDSPVAPSVEPRGDLDASDHLQMICAEAPISARESSDGAVSGNSSSMSASLAMSSLLAKMAPAWKAPTMQGISAAASAVRLPQVSGSMAQFEDGAAASYELASSMVSAWQEIVTVPLSLKSTNS